MGLLWRGGAVEGGAAVIERWFPNDWGAITVSKGLSEVSQLIDVENAFWEGANLSVCVLLGMRQTAK